MKLAKISQEIKQFRIFIGEEAARIFSLAIVIGFLWFASESGFVFILQSFLLSLGLLSEVSSLIPDWYPKGIEASLMILLMYGFVKSAILGFKQYFAGKVSQTFIRYKRSQIIETSLRNAQVESTDRVFVMFSERVNQVSYSLDVLFAFLNSAVSAVLFFAFSLVLAPKEMILGATLLFIFLIPTKALAKKISNNGELINNEYNAISESILNGLKNNFLLQIYQMVGSEIKSGQDRLKTYQKHYLHFLKVNSFKNVLPGFLGILVISIVTFFSVQYFGTEKTKLLAFYYIFIRAALSASDASSSFGYVRLNYPAFVELRNWLTLRPPTETAATTVAASTSNLEDHRELQITAKGVSFSYVPGTSVIKNLDLAARKGDFIVIRGRSGTGKSTLLSLLLGLLKPTSGKVLFNEEEISAVSNSWYKSLAFVGPEPFLVRGTVKQNLLYGHYSPASVTDQEVWNALEQVDLKKLVQEMPNSLQFPLNEKAQLSTGQKQRLAIARALLRKPRLLILDEATANIDQQTEEKIVGILRALKADMITIAVTHKESFDDLATKLIVLENQNG